MKNIRLIEPFVQTSDVLEERLQEIQRRYAHEGLTLSIDFPKNGSKLEVHESLSALTLAVPELVSCAIKAEREGIDGIVIDCMADPAVEVVRESVSIPVLGPGHSSMQVATMLGNRFSLLVTTELSRRYFLNYVNRLGLSPRLASCHAVNIPPDELTTDSFRTVELLVEVAKKAIVNDLADTLVLGCTGFIFHVEEMRKKLKAINLAAPLIDPIAVTINMLGALIDSGLTHSRIAYPDAGIARSIDMHGIPGISAIGSQD